MARKRKRSFGSSAATHRKRGTIAGQNARSHIEIFKIALRKGECTRALGHLLGAVRQLGAVTSHGESYTRKGGAHYGRGQHKLITALSARYAHACQVR